jgi:hypothetical protein
MMVADGSFPSTTHGPHCCCPACLGLQPFQRPVFAPGQVLTDLDLSADQAYAVGKNRLHNRYQHGWGVVCGLEVVCNDCDGYVTIHPGYAIDRCGNDIVVAADQSFNVIQAIQDCCNARQGKRGQCDPYVPPPDPGCKDVETYWCLTLCYKEVETARVMTLRTTLGTNPCTAPGSCGCGCGGGVAQTGCGCGCHGASKSGNSTKAAAAAAATTSIAGTAVAQGPASCQPRRLLECFDIGVMENPKGCAPAPAQRDVGTLAGIPAGGPTLGDLIPPGSFWDVFGTCVNALTAAVQKRSYPADATVLAALDNSDFGSVTAVQAHDAVCRFRQAMVDLYTADDHLTRCQLLRVLGKITLDPPGPNDTGQTYGPKAEEVYVELKTLALQYLLDCLCHSVLPPCPPDPCDDRLPIACITVKGGKIVDICNLSCRHYAGAFPSMLYWLSVVPIVPLLSWALQSICCTPDLLSANSPIVNALPGLLSALDPTGGLQRGLINRNFAAPSFFGQQLLSLQPGVFAAKGAKSLGVALTLPSTIGRNAGDVQQELASNGITAITRELPPGAPTPSSAGLLTMPFTGHTDNVVLYTSGGKIVAAAPASAADAASKDAQILDLQNQIKAMRDDIAQLKSVRPSGGSKK